MLFLLLYKCVCDEERRALALRSSYFYDNYILQSLQNQIPAVSHNPVIGLIQSLL